MTNAKKMILFALINFSCLGAMADQASLTQKLALVVSNPSLLDEVNIPGDSPALVGGEEVIKGDESSVAIVKLVVDGKDKYYHIKSDGGGQILSISLEAPKPSESR